MATPTVATGKKYAIWHVTASGSNTTTGNGTEGFVVPADMNGMDLIDVLGAVHTKGTTGDIDIQIRRRRAGTNADMLTTKVTIADSEFFAHDETVDTTKDDVNTGDTIYCDIDTIHTGTAAKGLDVIATFETPAA